MHFRRDARGQAPLSRKGPYVARPTCFPRLLNFRKFLDVNQFSIITELLGTPPDDVIETICSENVRNVDFCSHIACADQPGDSDPSLCTEPAETPTSPIQRKVTMQ